MKCLSSNLYSIKTDTTVYLLGEEYIKNRKKPKQSEDEKSDAIRDSLINQLIRTFSLAIFDVYESKKDAEAKKLSYVAIIVK